MNRFERGPGRATYEIADDGTLRAGIGGVLTPANAGALSALLLAAGADAGARGVLCSVQRALVALPPIGAQHYAYVPSALRGVPVAVVVTAEQATVYAGAALAAASTGTMRRAFLSPDEALAWLHARTQALAANRAWWSARRSPP